MKKTIAALLPLSALVACQTPYESAASPIGEAIVRTAEGAEVGTARLYAQGDAISINIALQMAGGSAVHAVHLHQTGTCDAPGFTSAGAHLNPETREHGLHNPRGPHLGDLPNITLSAAGAGTASATLAGTREAALAHIFDADGTAIIVHAAADDYRTDPTGGAGGRIACGVIQRG